jgi:hypothetical protein
MIGIYEDARSIGYVATRFLQMVSERGGLRTAHDLLATDTPSEGFTALWELRRLDLTVEAAVLEPEFESLFTDTERDVARRRLNDYGYSV